MRFTDTNFDGRYESKKYVVLTVIIIIIIIIIAIANVIAHTEVLEFLIRKAHKKELYQIDGQILCFLNSRETKNFP